MAEIAPLEIVQQAQPSPAVTSTTAQLAQATEERCAFAIPGDAGARRNEDFQEASRLEGHGPPVDSVRAS
jgi:hypothetical protein